MIHGLLDQILPGLSDEEDDPSPDARFVFSRGEPDEGVPSPGACSTLIVCSPGAASGFAAGALQLRAAPWRFELKGLERSYPPPPRPPKFFVVEGAEQAVAVALLDDQVPADLAVAWAEAALEAFEGASQVLFLDRLFRAEWRGLPMEEPPSEPHLCGLATTAASAEAASGLCLAAAALRPLPAPNVVEGLGAALLSRLEGERKACVVALALQDGAHLGAGTFAAFGALGPALEALGAAPGGWRPPDYTQVLRQVVPPARMAIYM